MRRGFTLIEMLVVLVLLGLITTLALPAMQRWHDAVQVRARAAGIVEALRAAQFAAGANRREAVMDDASFVQAAPVQARPDAGEQPAAASSAIAAAEPPSAPPTRRLEIVLPAGWRVERVAAARFMANGLCRPGEAAFRTERDEALMLRVLGPVCGVELATDRP